MFLAMPAGRSGSRASEAGRLVANDRSGRVRTPAAGGASSGASCVVRSG
jgi:hypothetical protein